MPRGGSYGDKNRDGIDDDFDRQPGNTSVSPGYARIYDRRSETEATNRLETANQIEMARILADIEAGNKRVGEALAHAQSDVHFFPSVGKFIIPEENTWIAHANLVKDKRSNLFFRPDKYVYFDKIIAEKFGPALYDERHKDYAKYEGLRTNLAVLRNDIIGMYLDDGAFNPGDEKFIPYIAGIAGAIGDALSNDKWYKRAFMPSLSVDVANVEGVGAREIYNYVLERQAKGKDTPLRRALTKVLGLPVRTWYLPPLEFTPYSPEGLSAPPPKTSGELSSSIFGRAGQSPDHEAQLANICEHCVDIAKQLPAPESLNVATQEKAIDEARTILRWLKNLQFGDKDMEEWLDQGTPAEQTAKAEAVARLVEIYGGQLKAASKQYPNIANDLVIKSSNQAAGAMSVAIAEYALDALPDGHPHIASLERNLDTAPASWELRRGQSVNRLLEQMEAGIEWASGKTVSDKSPAERLLEMSNRIQLTAKKLRSVDTLEPPAREESIELAREILRKLKGLGFADKPMEALLKPGDTADKAALAAQIDEMVDMYHNLLAEAAEGNPDILKDARILQANEAVGQFAHTVSLMAAKEIPVSEAATAQISADVTQMPEQWKNMDNRTIGRLVANMEGGLEKAMGDIQMQQEQAQQQDEELAKHSVENSLLGESAGRKKRRRRRRGGGSSHSPSLTKSAKRRNAADLNGDGIADRFQGLNLSDKDRIAIRDIGGSLRDIGQQATNIPPAPITDVGASDKIAPDDQSFAARKKEQDELNRQNRRNPRNNRPQI